MNAQLDTFHVTCDRCGQECSNGFERREYGTDYETGYQDAETVCIECLGMKGDSDD